MTVVAGVSSARAESGTGVAWLLHGRLAVVCFVVDAESWFRERGGVCGSEVGVTLLWLSFRVLV